MMTLIDVPLYKVYLDYRHADDLNGLNEAVEVAYQEELAKLEEVDFRAFRKRIMRVRTKTYRKIYPTTQQLNNR